MKILATSLFIGLLISCIPLKLASHSFTVGNSSKYSEITMLTVENYAKKGKIISVHIGADKSTLIFTVNRGLPFYVKDPGADIWGVILKLAPNSLDIYLHRTIRWENAIETIKNGGVKEFFANSGKCSLLLNKSKVFLEISDPPNNIWQFIQFNAPNANKISYCTN